MREIATKPIDEVGRVVIPADWRKEWGKRVIIVRLSGDEVLVRALKKRGKLTDLVDAIEIEGVEDFSDTDQLRRSIHG